MVSISLSKGGFPTIIRNIPIVLFVVICITSLLLFSNHYRLGSLIIVSSTEAFTTTPINKSFRTIRGITTTQLPQSLQKISNIHSTTTTTNNNNNSMRRREGTITGGNWRNNNNSKDGNNNSGRSLLLLFSNNNNNKGDVEKDEEICLIGENVVQECEDVQVLQQQQNKKAGGGGGVGGGESQSSASINLAKCICGAGSFALPHVFLEEGLLGGTLALTACGVLATWTMHSLADSKFKVAEITTNNKNNNNQQQQSPTSYVELARVALGEPAAKLVFALTLSASIGVCSTYLVFIGSTLESMSQDATAQNIVRDLWPDVSERQFEMVAAAILFPLSLVRDYSIFAFTSALGVIAVVGGIAVTLAYGILVNPGGGLSVALDSISTLPLWPSSISTAFGGSFGTICYLFAINFLTFPVINSMAQPQRDYNGAVSRAVAGVWLLNIVFSIIALGFYKENTQDLILANLDNGPYLSALKLLLCVDLLFTFPIVFSSGRQILENAILGTTATNDNTSTTTTTSTFNNTLAMKRAGIVAGAITTCFGMAQIGGFGAVANLVGGVAQGTLAFIMPPAIALALSQQQQQQQQTYNNNIKTNDQQPSLFYINQYATATFGIVVVSAVTYFTFTSI